ncbi:hypothetical protein HK101_005991 [Irineochytrium annulatum]|nr:hypothetical protein HK101_005991 [Irineochytrium annulatum]
MKEFSDKMRSWSNRSLSGLKGNYPADHDDVIDDAAEEFLREYAAEAKREEIEGPYRESAGNQHIRNLIKKELGPFARG